MVRVMLSLIPVLVLFLIAFILGRYNAEAVQVNLLFMRAETTMAMVIAVTLFIGFLLGLGVMSFAYLKIRLQNRKLKKAVIKISKQNTDTSPENKAS
ncbi:hypothetical protein CWE08_03865 [Aliidiomarina iranensis]|uniref:Lipopolysaccharide assembly protein A domain-containing protein n=1 Tax=Aliidiomarina iranensis TaxID=1434071 RepID=A0A432VZY5_9GAMM|nr:LapA family protein [Aliidiomarina iranensis]RUO22329.1 hypothetical protein CWE08_03865 [Aliidiomarina iranensis]